MGFSQTCHRKDQIWKLIKSKFSIDCVVNKSCEPNLMGPLNSQYQKWKFLYILIYHTTPSFVKCNSTDLMLNSSARSAQHCVLYYTTFSTSMSWHIYHSYVIRTVWFSQSSTLTNYKRHSSLPYTYIINIPFKPHAQYIAHVTFGAQQRCSHCTTT